MCRVELAAQLARNVPVGEEAELLPEKFPAVIGQQAGAARPLNPQQRVECVSVERSGVVLVERVQVSRAAQIREQEKTLFEVLRMDFGNVHSGLGEDLRHVHERPAVLPVGRGVHHDERGLCFAASNPEIAPEARVVGGRRDTEIAVPEGCCQPSPQLLRAVQKSS